MAIAEKAPSVPTPTHTVPEEYPERAPLVLGWVVMMGVMAWAGAHPEESVPRIKEALAAYNTIFQAPKEVNEVHAAYFPNPLTPIR